MQHTCRVTWCLKLPSISNSTSLFSSKLRQSKTFYRSVFHIKGTLCSLTRLVKSFVLFVFRVSNLAFILRSFQLKTTASANLKVVLNSMHELCPYQAVTNCYSFNFPRFLRFTYYGGSYYVIKLSYSILV